MWPVQLYNIFPHFLTNGKIKKKNYWTQIFVLIVSKTFFLKGFSFYEEFSEMIKKIKFVFKLGTRYSYQI